ncbi:MAG: aconitase family protein [Candidatus Levybacteria bacterium]|nr:aconitase family protein [Candidatus Levybacteria bacterium]
MNERERTRLPENLISSGRILYLTKNPEIIRKQLEGQQFVNISNEELLESISTDEIIPNKAGLAYTGSEEGHLGNFALTGLRGNIIGPGEVVRGNFQTIVAGPSFARGSSRIHAPLALQEAGINLVIADAERIFSDNCINCGIYIIKPDSGSAQKLLRQLSVPENEILKGMSQISQEIMKAGGLLSYFKTIEEKKLTIPAITTQLRPMTMTEKIIAQKAINQDGNIGVIAVKPGDECIVQPNKYYGYELQTPIVRTVLKKEFGDKIPVKHKEKIVLHNDHTALLQGEIATTQRKEQSAWGESLGVTVYELTKNGAPAICHTKMLEDYALPGQLILGNDSHTCTLGVINALAIGKGAIDLAGAIAYDRMILSVPESIRINFQGKLPRGVTMKDFMLQFGATQEVKKHRIGSGKVFEFGGEALSEIPFDEQLKLTNMSIELLGFSGIVEPNKQIIKYLKEKRGLTEDEISRLMVASDPKAEYAHIFNIDLSTVEPTVATPGDTQNGKPLSEIEKQNIHIQKAYLGSCTHGTPEDLRQAAEIVRGKKIAQGVKLFIQANSLANLDESIKKGYIKDLTDAGAQLLPIGCGACMNAGPGSTEEGEIGIFATNRNFPGRTGKGETYLASSLIVAASAIKGIICGPLALE